MSDAPFAADPATVAGQPRPLTPGIAENLLGELAAWLEREPPPLADASEPTVDLFSLVGQFTALKQEINLQTKATRGTLEQNAAALERVDALLAEVRKPPVVPLDPDEILRPVVKALLDAYDALTVAGREVARLPERLAEVLAPLHEPLPELPRVGNEPTAGAGAWFWRTSTPEARRSPVVDQLTDRAKAALTAAGQVRGIAQGAATGYQMSLKRMERLLEQLGLTPILSSGQPFDPERMEVVEVARNTGRPAGEVAQEVRRGWLWRGRLFRYAQVSVTAE